MALEDTLIYLIPREVFAELFDQHESFADLVEVEDRTRLRQVMSRKRGRQRPAVCHRRDLVGRGGDPPSTATARELAQRMSGRGVSSLLISTTTPRCPACPSSPGIVTDRDLRTRLVAPGLAYDTPATEIMSAAWCRVTTTSSCSRPCWRCCATTCITCRC